jgi:hypothetical protein
MILNQKYDANSLLLTGEKGSTDRMLYLDFTSDTRDMWIVQFCSTEVLTFENLKKIIPADILDQIRNKKIVLLLENFDNPDIENLVNCIYQEVVINGNIPVGQIKLLSYIYDIFYQIKPAAEKFNLDEIEFEYYNYWEAKFKKIYNRSVLRPISPRIKKSYNKKFVCLIKRYQPERCMIFILLNNRNLIDQGYVSFTSSNYDPPWSEIINNLYDSFPRLTHEIDQLDPDIENKIPLHLDEMTRHTPSRFLLNFHSGLDSCYVNSYFSIVSETNFSRRHGSMVTEKIIRAIVNRHPFIMVASDHYLALLRLLGYKTFDGIIDESYDLETDHNTRLIKIVNEVDRLCKLTGNELQDFLIKSQEICEYNFQRFLNNSDNYIYNKEQLLCQQFI